LVWNYYPLQNGKYVNFYEGINGKSKKISMNKRLCTARQKAFEGRRVL